MRHNPDVCKELLERLLEMEAAITAIKKYKASPEDAAKDMNAPLELVLEALNQKK